MLFWVLFGIVFITIFFRQNQKTGFINVLKNFIYFYSAGLFLFLFKVPFYNFKTGMHLESHEYAKGVFGCLFFIVILSSILGSHHAYVIYSEWKKK